GAETRVACDVGMRGEELVELRRARRAEPRHGLGEQTAARDAYGAPVDERRRSTEVTGAGPARVGDGARVEQRLVPVAARAGGVRAGVERLVEERGQERQGCDVAA